MNFHTTRCCGNGWESYNFAFEQILSELPDLEVEDIKASIKYARRSVDHPVIAA